VYDGTVSQIAQQAVWFVLADGLVGNNGYRARNFVYVYDKWVCADTTTANLGYTVDTISSVWGNLTGWQFETQIFYNEVKVLFSMRWNLLHLLGGWRLALTQPSLQATQQTV